MHVTDLVGVNLLERLGGRDVAARARGRGVVAAEVEVRMLERQPHRTRELERAGEMIELVPEMPGHRVIAERRIQRGHAIEIELHVALLVGEDRDEAATKRQWRLRIREHRPREQLDRLELVVRERVKDPCALRWIAHPGEWWHACFTTRFDRELGRSSRRWDPQLGLAVLEHEL